MTTTQNEYDKAANAAALPRRVKVLFPLPLPKAYDYLVDEKVAAGLETGGWVIAPLGGTMRRGLVWRAASGNDDTVDLSKLKAVESVIDAPRLGARVLEFVEWVAAYTMAPLGSVLRLVMRGGDALEPPKGITGYRRSAVATEGVRMTESRAAVLAAAGDAPLTAKDLAAISGASDAVVRGLAKAGLLKAVLIDPDAPFKPPDLTRQGRDLSNDQRQAVDKISMLIERAATPGVKSPPILIDGVTGAGKTEVYLEAVAAALASDQSAQALIMLPEIALTVPFLRRVEERFGAAPAGWHSDMGGAERRRVWRRVLDGSARIVVGARSAMFLPYRNLSLIVVDEEHENGYKQEDGVIYQARDMAVARGALGRFPVILASATPSLETVVNVDQGRYEIARLTSRFGGASLPDIALIDLRKEPPDAGKWLSPPLVDAVNETKAKGEQSLLFLNRRGYAPLTICRKCGHRMKAPDSDTWLVEHRFENRLVCHHTGFSMPKPSACPVCHAVGSLTASGPGVERVAEEAKERWPDARLAILSSDMILSPTSMRETMRAMQDGEIDILVATQVVAKGHHFPNLTLVGVVDADMGLAGGDLRGAERTFQLLSQVSGRAGREQSMRGRALLQTHQPEAPVLTALRNGDRDSFLAAEAEGREQMGFPPYGRLAAIILRSASEQALKEMANAHKAAIPSADGVEVWGPAPAPLYRLRGEARMRFLVKTRRDVNIQAFLATWLSRTKLRGPVRRSVDVDPYSFL